jgi:undecaprenyl-diphosphatase
MSVDHSIFYRINHADEAWAPLMKFMSQGLNYWPTKLLLALLVGWLIWKAGSHRKAAITALVGFLVSDGTCTLLKSQFPMPRPFKDPEMLEVVLRIGKKSDNVGFGTASSHSANMAAVAIAFWLCLGWRWGLPWAVVALLTGISRIYNGVHFPYQVALGWTVGTVMTSLIWLIITKLSTRKDQPAADSSSETSREI